jgi:glutathione S-transferase
MSDTIIFWYNPMSRARIVHWMLEEVGAPYEPRLLDLQKGEQKQPDFLAINPMGKVPTIQHRGVVVTEAAAICAYLADAFPRAGLAPSPSDARRGAYYRWLFFGAGCIEPALVDRLFSRPLPDRPAALGYGSYDDVMRTLEEAVQPGPYLLGDAFSAADVYVASQVIWGTMVNALTPGPALKAYVERCTERPAYKRSMEKLASA